MAEIRLQFCRDATFHQAEFFAEASSFVRVDAGYMKDFKGISYFGSHRSWLATGVSHRLAPARSKKSWQNIKSRYFQNIITLKRRNLKSYFLLYSSGSAYEEQSRYEIFYRESRRCGITLNCNKGIFNVQSEPLNFTASQPMGYSGNR